MAPKPITKYVTAEISPALFLLYIFIAWGSPARAIIIPTTVANIDKGDMSKYNRFFWEIGGNYSGNRSYFTNFRLPLMIVGPNP